MDSKLEQPLNVFLSITVIVFGKITVFNFALSWKIPTFSELTSYARREVKGVVAASGSEEALSKSLPKSTYSKAPQLWNGFQYEIAHSAPA